MSACFSPRGKHFSEPGASCSRRVKLIGSFSIRDESDRCAVTFLSLPSSKISLPSFEAPLNEKFDGADVTQREETSMLRRSEILALGIVLAFGGLIAVISARNAIGQSGTRQSGGFGGGGGGGSPAVGGGGGGIAGPQIDPLGLAYDLVLSSQLSRGSTTDETGVAVTIGERLAEYVVAAQYRNWAPAPGQDDNFLKGHLPHGTFVKTYVNRNVAAGSKDPGYGSILLQENYSKDKKRLLDVTVMCRIEGCDPDHNDWFWAQYLPNGAIAREGKAKLAGRVQSCIGCHSRADGNDFIFSNDLHQKGK